MLPVTFSPVKKSLEYHCRIEVSKEQFGLSSAELEHLVSNSRPLCCFLATARVLYVKRKKHREKSMERKTERV